MANPNTIARAERLLRDPRLPAGDRAELQQLLDRAKGISPDQARALARLDLPRDGDGARVEGSSLILEYTSPERAAQRVRELSGQVGPSTAPNLARVSRMADQWSRGR